MSNKNTDRDSEAAHELAEKQAIARREVEVESDAALDPLAMVQVMFTGGAKGTAKHHMWKQPKKVGELPSRRMLEKGDKVEMTRKRFAAVKDRFTLVKTV